MKKIYLIVSAIVLIWMMASYVEIISKNTKPNPEYSNLNIIVRVFEEGIE